MAKRNPEKDKLIAEILREKGAPHLADYIEMFGSDNTNPWFWRGSNEKTEEFYKKCVEEKHPWDFYMDAPPEKAEL